MKFTFQFPLDELKKGENVKRIDERVERILLHDEARKKPEEESLLVVFNNSLLPLSLVLGWGFYLRRGGIREANTTAMFFPLLECVCAT